MNLSIIKADERYAQSPDKGTCLAYFQRKVLLAAFSNRAEVESMLDDSQYGELLEVHLFNSNKEFRAISAEGKRYDKEIICHIADFKLTDEDKEQGTHGRRVYVEKTKIGISDKSNPYYEKELWVLNRLAFNGGMAYVDDYRLMIGGEE